MSRITTSTSRGIEWGGRRPRRVAAIVLSAAAFVGVSWSAPALTKGVSWSAPAVAPILSKGVTWSAPKLLSRGVTWSAPAMMQVAR